MLKNTVMKNIDNCPNEILELLQTTSFSQLNQLEKEMVLMYLNEVEYEDYRISLNELKIELNEQDDEVIPSIFHQTFESKKEKKPFVLHIQAWQLAASLILIGGLWIWTLKHKSNQEPVAINSKDTIYLSNNSNIESIKVYDTIFIKKTIISKKKSAITKKDTALNYNNKSNEEIQIDQLNAIRNQRKYKGIKGDSLLKNFEFVRI
jgi:hypothetical protein